MDKSILLCNSDLPEDKAVCLYNGWIVNKELYKTILRLVETFIPFMARGHIYIGNDYPGRQLESNVSMGAHPSGLDTVSYRRKWHLGYCQSKQQ